MFDSAVPALRESRLTAILLLLAATYAVLGTLTLAVVGLLEPIAAALDTSLVAVANLVTVFALVYALAAPVLQVAFGHWPFRRLLAAGLALLGGSAFVSAVAGDYPTMLAGRVLMALAGALLGPLLSIVAVALVGPGRQGRALSLVFGGMTLAMVLGVPASSGLGRAFGWQAVFAGLGAAALALALAAAWLLPARAASPRTELRAFGCVLGERRLVLPVAMTLSKMAGQFVVYALLGPLLMARFGLAAADVALALLAFGVGGVLGNAAAGRLTDRLGAGRALSAALAGEIVALVLLAVLPGGTPVALTLVGAWAFCAVAFNTPQQKRLVGLAPSLGGLLLALNASALYLGIALGSALGGSLYRLLGLEALPPAAAALLLATLGLYAVARRSAEEGVAAGKA